MLRLPNLGIIILTQYLLEYGIIRPVLQMQGVGSPLGHLNFFLLVLVTVCIAAGGYIINDHFDVNTDRRNKPGRNALEGMLSVRKALNVYYILNIFAVAAGFYLAYLAGSYQLGLIFPAIAGLLWFYSSRYQRQPFWGNLIIAVLTAMVVLVVWLFEFFMLLNNSVDFVDVISLLDDINNYVWAYALFAFLLSLIRELLKDIQDIEGDRLTGYRTLPVIWSMARVKALLIFLCLVTLSLMALVLFFLYERGMVLTFWYLLVVVSSLMVYLLLGIIRAKSAAAFALLQNTARIIMLAGVLSMELIYISL